MTTNPPVTNQPPAPTPGPTIHIATRAMDGSGAVEWSDLLTLEEAIDRRKNGLDVVVRGSDKRANRRLAGTVEAGVGPPSPPQFPHTATAGPYALPHFHQASRTPIGHSFYEVDGVKARKKP